ncbi:hypothetical protein LRP30_21385 [Bradyrhizobium sp. C-145]|uniref:hypothetical protein n=1 Tax=Bradyrhizobium sp. C-145 TaxID=574727 RepID=UPI00201B7341|nr:hypothetical protein [Bradyrhizobium sp. C-145]UQR67643.1 hypothetical protein LRP30_21385 [Bradyrhizobium sp. C-145]
MIDLSLFRALYLLKTTKAQAVLSFPQFLLDLQRKASSSAIPGVCSLRISSFAAFWIVLIALSRSLVHTGPAISFQSFAGRG